MRSGTFLLFAAMVMGLSFAACNCGNPPPGNDGGPENDGGPTTDGGPGQTDGGPGQTDGGPGSQCLASGATCSTTSGSPCCSGVCQGGVCTTPTFCKAPGDTCAASTECCSNSCLNGKCSAQQCLDVSQACTDNNQCCSLTCTNGACASPPNGGACKVLGQACTSGSQCCSTNCQGGVCVRAFSCNAYNDICLTNSDCCSGQCSATGGNAGYCINPSGGTGCIESGNPCAGGTNCCTRVCLDQGTGATVCQPVGGCRVAGDECSTNATCCGGQPVGSVQCISTSNRCDNGQACRAPGTICGKPTRILPDGGHDWVYYPDGGQFTVNNETNCCDGNKVGGSGGMELTCRVDRAGVPRCFGGGSVDGGACQGGYNGQPGCCISEGNTCQFRDQCCNGALCIPGADGGPSVCSKATCAPVGSTCNPAASDCCSGTSCLPAGELSYACVTVTPGSDGGSGGGDGGTGSDGGVTCRANGSACTSAANCCSGICNNGTCQAPASCQPQGATCTSGGDCCAGLSCNLNGGAVGTCQTSSTSCSSLGQACSPTVTCCSGLDCLDAVGLPCSGSTACACSVIIR